MGIFLSSELFFVAKTVILDFLELFLVMEFIKSQNSSKP